MVRGFGLLLVIGIALAFASALTAGSAALALRDARRAPRATRRARCVPRPPSASPAARRRGARELLADATRATLERVRSASPQRVLAIAAALAVARLGRRHADAASSPTSAELVPADLPALQDLDTLQDATGLLGRDRRARARPRRRPTRGRALDEPTTSSACSDASATTSRRAAAAATLCPAFSLPDLLQGSRRAHAAGDRRAARGRPAVLLRRPSSRRAATPRRSRSGSA